MNILATIFVLLVSQLAYAQTSLSVPNSFTNGQIIDADKINQNFTEIETHVNSNQGHKHLYVVDANSQILGQVFNFHNEGATLITNQGFMASIYSNEGTGVISTQVFRIYYESTNCTGQGYMVSPFLDENENRLRLVKSRTLFWDGPINQYVYLDQNSQIPLSYGSYRGLNSDACNNSLGNWTLVNPVLVNDMNVTGMPNSIVFPITLEYK
jgi:hypothetical protein